VVRGGAPGGAPHATDDATLVESVGGTVMVVEGDPMNLKITTRHDLGVARLHFS